jgi:hypothetical protein
MGRGRLYLGLIAFGLAWLLPLSSFFILSTNLPQVFKVTFVGMVSIGGPEVLGILAIALLGKENFDLFKNKIVEALKMAAPKGSVSRLRYKVGLVMFILPVIPTYIMGYVPEWLPDSSPWRLYVSVAADVCFLSSLFVLGGDFWDKLSALFIYDATVNLPGRMAGKSEDNLTTA